MAMTIKNGKVVHKSPPKKLTQKQRLSVESAPVNKTLIKRATSRNYNVV